MDNTPLISVVIPCFNAELYVQQAIDSVLCQTYKNIEVIVVDDGSQDNSLQVLHTNYTTDKRIKILTHPDKANLGVSKTRKAGIDASSGEYIAYLDADDLFLENKIEEQVKIFQANPALMLVHNSVKVLAEEKGASFKNFERFPDSRAYSFLKTKYLKRNDICNSSVMIPKRAVMDLPNYFDQLYQYEDWINWILIAQKGNFYYNATPLTIYRYHSSSFTSNVLRNKLKKQYASLEMTLILLSRVTDKKVLLKLNKNLFQQLENLYERYQPENSKKRLTFYAGFIYSLLNGLKPKR